MPNSQPEQIKDPIEQFDYTPSELVIGVVCAVGTDYKPISIDLADILKQYGYETRVVKISNLIPNLTDSPINTSSEINRITSFMDAGNKICRDSKRKDLLALAAAADINAIRKKTDSINNLFLQEPLPRIAHLLLTLKRPEEVATLRKIYGDGFFLIGVFATEKERLEHLLNQNAPKQSAIKLIQRDSEETDHYGQQTRATFHLSDVFVKSTNREYVGQLQRFFDLVFADPSITPTQREHAMFLAYASSLRSGQLRRQVGAAIT